MDLASLLTSSVVAALVSGVVAVANAWWRGNVDEKLARLKSQFDNELAEQKNHFDKELAEQKARLDDRVAFAAERVAHQLLMDKKWRLRSFGVIKHHLKGFEDDDLRQILVRAGAISFVSRDGIELWGLLDRNTDRLGVEEIASEPGYEMVGSEGERRKQD